MDICGHCFICHTSHTVACSQRKYVNSLAIPVDLTLTCVYILPLKQIVEIRVCNDCSEKLQSNSVPHLVLIETLTDLIYNILYPSRVEG